MKKAKPESDLLAQAVPEAAPSAAGSGLRLNRGKGGAGLSAAQQRFNRLLAKISKLEGQVTEMQKLADAYRPLYQRTLAPLRDAQKALMRRMALCLDERLQRKGLTPTQQRDGVEVLCRLCQALAAAGDEAMVALHDRHSPRTLRQKEEVEAAMMRAMMEEALGQPLDMDAQDESLDPLEAVMRASQARLHETMRAEEARQQRRREASQARKRKNPTPAQHKAAQEQEEADTVLRQVYRQLASALHPDRERDPAEHRRKNTLMSEANAAYARQDLMALLHLQLRIAQADAHDLLRQPEERIAAMSRLLKQQAAELESELFARQRQLQQEFDLAFYQTPSAAMLQRELASREQALKDELAFMESDLALVQDDAAFKRWLKAQVRLARQHDGDRDYF